MPRTIANFKFVTKQVESDLVREVSKMKTSSSRSSSAARSVKELRYNRISQVK